MIESYLEQSANRNKGILYSLTRKKTNRKNMIALLEWKQNVFLKVDNGCMMLFPEGISQWSGREILCSHHTTQYNLLAVSKVLLHKAIAAIGCDDLNIGTSVISLYRDFQCHLGNLTFFIAEQFLLYL